MDIYREILTENIEYDILCENHPHGSEEIGEILELMLETVCSTKKTIRIGGEDKPAEVVKSRMMKLDSSHIEYVLETLSNNTTDVRNIKSYLLTTLYNAPFTIENYYKSRVNHDLYGH
jgi:transposase